MKQKTLYKTAFTFLTVASLLAGCSGDNELNGYGGGTVNSKSNKITFNTNVSNFISKAATYDSNEALQAEESFTCTAYDATTTAAYAGPTKVEWNGEKWQYADGAEHDWPGTSALDFFAYMPAEKPTYISSISYTTARQPQFVCTLPTEQPSTVKEFICALATDKTQANSSSGVGMTFKHHFAKLLFKLDPESGSNVTINSVKISGIKTTGTCTFDGTNSTWVTSGEDSYVMATAIDGATPYLVIPNDYRATTLTITVNATWTSISNVTGEKVATIKDVSKEVGGDTKYLKIWEPGYSYLFTLTLSGDALEVNTEKWVEQW